jgi:hypothetical protein
MIDDEFETMQRTSVDPMWAVNRIAECWWH